MSSEPITSVFNDGYIAEAYESFRRDPSSVDESWRQFFRFAESLAGTSSTTATADRKSDPTLLRKVASAAALVQSIRAFGHLAAHIDPLGNTPPGTPELSLEFHGLTEEDLVAIPGAAFGFPDETASDAVDRLRKLYSSNVGFEFDHLGEADEREWLKDRIESGSIHEPLSADEKKAVLRRLTEVDGLERFLGRAYQGYKRFSIEGIDMMVPMLDAAIEAAGRHGTREVGIAMAHRGRINVLAHVLGKPYKTIFGEFEGRHADANAESETGDVKYHLGFTGVRKVGDQEVTVSLIPNPSHLEVANPVLQGVARARQTLLSRAKGRDENSAVPICIHGDAAFPGEGVVAETFNMSRLRGYRVGGTLHIIANNQVGFTTDPIDARSTHYASDLAKGFEVPIVHVDSEDANTCIRVMQLGVEYRTKYGKDFLIDLVGYRRHGHNETDEPAFTQPAMYSQIRIHPSPREVWGQRLVEEGVVTAEEVTALDTELASFFEKIQSGASPSDGERESPGAAVKPTDGSSAEGTTTPLPGAEQLVALNEQLLAWPQTFKPNAKLAKTLQRRRDAMGKSGGIDWGHAEALAFASLLVEGQAVRITGQDVERGTFSHRQAVLHDAETGQTYTPLEHLPEAKAKFEIYNSPLSETAVLGFEYGYSTATRHALVLWEAQFGDFVNVAQPIIDQFIVADHAKWGQDSGVTMLLPHGYEGQGPEHSSARLERFLQSAAESNMSVAYLSTPAQYYHILRRQALRGKRRPLVLMQPKSLLRLPEAASHLSDLTDASFRTVIDDAAVADSRESVKRLVFCTGKVYYDLLARRAPHVALVRVEELYPWPNAEVEKIVDLYPSVEEVVWAQEEPKNMGAWTYVAPRLRVSTGNSLIVRYIGRPERASPAEGYASAHKAEQERIVSEVVAPMESVAGSRRRSAVAG
ncbi:MAG TPA: 2-oxoglutarate dehydrogenase E1 component [Gemmatimonadaceae bacterium]|nr:2-oxoglutarate dehydrogenase E1 component [Gemmatimonadaceae bacterium]